MILIIFVVISSYRPAFKDRAVANLRRFLQYFERIASSEGVMTGDTIFERQVCI